MLLQEKGIINTHNLVVHFHKGCHITLHVRESYITIKTITRHAYMLYYNLLIKRCGQHAYN